MKQCGKCKKQKDYSDFYKHKSRKDGLQNRCKQCIKEYSQTEIGRQTRRKAVNKNYRTIIGRLHSCFRDMKRRCENPRNSRYKNYGGRGIKCLFQSSAEFTDYVMNELGYDIYEKIAGLQIDRVNNDGSYEKGNIRFTTTKVSINNRRNFDRKGENSGHAKLTERQVLEIRDLYKSGNFYQHQLADRFGIKSNTVSNIVNGKSWTHI